MAKKLGPGWQPRAFRSVGGIWWCKAELPVHPIRRRMSNPPRIVIEEKDPTPFAALDDYPWKATLTWGMEDVSCAGRTPEDALRTFLSVITSRASFFRRVRQVVLTSSAAAPAKVKK